MRRNQFAIRKNIHARESIKTKMKTELYCEACFENFTKDTIWDMYDIDGKPICEKCYDEMYAEL